MSTDQAPPTLEHVAKVAGVSRATVSRVVNGIRNVDPELREAVERAIEQTGYVPNRAARSLVTRRTGTLALVVSEPTTHTDAFAGGVFADPFFGRVVSGVLRVLGPMDVNPVLVLVDSDKARDQLMGRLRQDRFDGVLLISIDPRDPLPAMLTLAGVPTVMFARPVQPIAISYVDVAHQDGARLAADHLVERGCRQVATISGPLDTPAGQDRLAGFRSAMARHGQAYVPGVEGDFTQSGGERATELLLGTPFDGLFVANDLMAMGALDVLRRHGKRVPEDVKVIGFDDSGAALSCRPQLTTIRQPVEDMAAEMARLVIERVHGVESQVTSVIFEPSLVVRASS
ncbi:LacI family DNA-binding transcriptional regulator [Kutzneria sp. NPDC052558]|uniref:LacI family DNA-binding transcriptional regulator n=1 Tax=Kutzneria sp. NPDC052558 TaxID=3364121 RepID=UPI0037C84703